MEADIAEIRHAIRIERQRRGVSATYFDRLPELSGELGAQAEIDSFIERQLMPVHDGYGGWHELSDDNLRAQILKRLRGKS